MFLYPSSLDDNVSYHLENVPNETNKVEVELENPKMNREYVIWINVTHSISVDAGTYRSKLDRCHNYTLISRFKNCRETAIPMLIPPGRYRRVLVTFFFFF